MPVSDRDLAISNAGNKFRQSMTGDMRLPTAHLSSQRMSWRPGQMPCAIQKTAMG
jgi:hypothetical protein